MQCRKAFCGENLGFVGKNCTQKTRWIPHDWKILKNGQLNVVLIGINGVTNETPVFSK